MKDTRLLIGMPITVEVLDPAAGAGDLDAVYAYFAWVDDTFSTYKPSSEVSRLNRGELREDQCGEELRAILSLAEQTRQETHGYFDIRRPDGGRDPSGIVKGWAIREAVRLLRERGLHDFYVDAGGDVQVSGSKAGQPWRVGIRNPFNRRENVKVLALGDRGVATSGTAVRGQHIYDPHRPDTPLLDVASITVVGPDVYEADRFATAAFAMGRAGIRFIEERPGLEGYLIDAHARATYTSGFERYVLPV
jgi:thiamine biosynthesis lipoprotein